MARFAAAPLVALSVSLGLHAAAFSALPMSPPSDEGAGTPATVRLGNGFEDLAAGAMPVPVSKVAKPVPAEARTASAGPSASPVPVTPLAPSATSTTTAPLTPAEVVAGRESETGPETSPVPQARPEPKVAAKAQPTARTSPPPGDAAADARAGTSTGSAAGTASTPSKALKTGKGSGVSTANYPGLVMKKLRSTRKDRVPGGGKAVVGFVVAANGSVAEVRIIRASGNAALDAAALAFVRRAAPFPAPPGGDPQKFSFEFGSG